MTALAIIEPEAEASGISLARTSSFEDWRKQGEQLATTRRTIDWLLGDWLAHGREHFEPEQIELALADMTEDPKALRKVERVAKTFPPHLRNTALTFEHHAHVADLPVQEALPLLKQASDEHMPARQLRLLAMDRKVETGQLLPREDDPEDDELLALVRAWNRARHSVREDFAEMVAESHMGVIEP